MKWIKLLFLMYTLSFFVSACDDDDDNKNPDPNQVPTEQVGVSFGKTSLTVLKNDGKIQIPLKLEKATTGIVRVSIAPKTTVDGAIAEEGIDYTITEKVIHIPAGQTEANVEIELLDNRKADGDKNLVLEIKNVYQSGKKSGTDQSCAIRIASNSFIEFASATKSIPETDGDYQIPLLIAGNLSAETKVQVIVADKGTAIENTHYKLKTPEITLAPGATTGHVILTVTANDPVSHPDRTLNLVLSRCDGGNTILGLQDSCEITLISQNPVKWVSFANPVQKYTEDTEVEIPITLSEPFPTDVEVTFDIRPGSDAIKDVDFSSSLKTTIPANTKYASLPVKMLYNTLIANRTLELEIIGINNPSLAPAQNGNVCNITIENTDYPEFSQDVYNLVEAGGRQNVRLTFPAQPSEMTLTLETIDGTATAGKHFNLPLSQITVAAGETSVDIPIDIQYDENWNDPEFTLKISKANNVDCKNHCSATIAITPCQYRKLLGKWNMKCDAPSNIQSPCIVTVKPKVFNESYTCEAAIRVEWDHMHTWTMKYNKQTQQISVVLLEDMLTSPHVVFRLWSAATQNSLSTQWDGDNILRWDVGGDFLCGMADDGGAYWWFATNVRMERME